MVGLIVILLYACKVAFLVSSTCIKIIEFSLKNEARKAYLRAHKRMIIILFLPFMKEVYDNINFIKKDQCFETTTSNELYPFCLGSYNCNLVYPQHFNMSVFPKANLHGMIFGYDHRMQSGYDTTTT